MSGIDKVCELSGEYCGPEMYDWKRNQLQIKYNSRKRFRGAEHVLHIFKPVKVTKYRNYRIYSDFEPELYVEKDKSKIQDRLEENDGLYVNGCLYLFQNEAEYVLFLNKKLKQKVVSEYEFCLEVHSDYLKGEVNGMYMNYTRDLKTMKRKMKRLLRCKELNIVKHNCTYWEWKNG